MSSTDPASHLNPEHGDILLDIARKSVETAIRTGHALDVDLSVLPPQLSSRRATFVSLHRAGDLLGCIGSLSAVRPLAVDVAENAAAAVLRDPRCPVLHEGDSNRLDVDISLLTPSVRLDVSSEAELIHALRPGLDGVTIEGYGRRGTFLPVVWESIPDPEEFVRHLKQKAGLPEHGWDPGYRVSRYETVTICS